jgi:hypothetical protein
VTDCIPERGKALVALAALHFPREINVASDADAWPLIGAGLISRMTTTLRSILVLQPTEREADAGVLVRSLYEHAVHLAWLAAHPDPLRFEEWRKDDLSSRLKADSDARVLGVEIFTAGQRTELEGKLAGMRGSPLVLANLAVAADKHWANKLPGMGGHHEVQSFRGLYAILYRNYSGLAHPTFRGLNPVVEGLGRTRRRIVLEQPYTSNGPYGIATVIFALGLHVAALTLGWPRRDDVDQIFERYPARS